MEVDTNGMSHLSIAATEGAISDAPSPAVEEPPPPPPTTKEIGESRMTQSERLQQLKPEATILNIAPPELHIQKPQAVQIDHATFSPSEPNALLLAGDHLARIYLIPTNMNSTTVPDPSSGNLYLDVAGLTPNFRVLACAWIAPLDGAALAVWETHRNEKGDIRHKGRLVQVGKVSGTSDAFAVTRTLANHIRDVVALRWNPSSRSLLCLSITDKGSIIRAWTDDFEESIPLFQTKWQLYDVQWISRTQFVACGEAISIFDINHTAEGYRIKCIHDSLDDRDSIRLVWHRLAYDPNTSMIAAISLDGPDLALLDAPSGERSVAYQNAPFAAPAESAEDISSRKYYSYEIPVDDAASAVAVAFQPIQNPVSLAPDAPRLLATALDDGLIIILDARRRWNIITWLALGMGKAVEACAWSGDGFLLAAAGGGRVVVWRAEDILAAKGQVKSVVPRAVWVVAQERKWGESRAVVRKGTPAPGAVQPQLTEGDKQERAETEKEKEKTNEVNGATVPNGVDHSAMDIDVQLRPHNNGVNEARSESDYGEDKVSQLIWDQDGKKLIYTTGDQVCFPPSMSTLRESADKRYRLPL